MMADVPAIGRAVTLAHIGKTCGKCRAPIFEPTTASAHELCQACTNSIPMLDRDALGTRRKTWFPATDSNGGEHRATDILLMPFEDSIAFFDRFCHETSIPLVAVAGQLTDEE